MLPDWLVNYVGGGILVLLCYIIISNTLWLLIGAKFLQFLPGVSDKSAKGTLKIVLLLLMSLIGIFWWIVKLIPSLLQIVKFRPITMEISLAIQNASRIYYKFEKGKK